MQNRKIEVITRKKVFSNYRLIDNWISSMQKSYASDFDLAQYADQKIYRKYYDHIKPLNPQKQTADDFCVMAYQAKNRAEYLEQLPKRLVLFFKHLGIEKILLADWLSGNWLYFPFENFKKRNALKLVAGKKLENVIFRLETDSLQAILPFFLYSNRYDMPVIMIFPEDSKVPFAMNMCDDGNFHINFLSRQRLDIERSAKAAGFICGGTEICGVVFTACLR